MPLPCADGAGAVNGRHNRWLAEGGINPSVHTRM